jgi:hypothetical protein
MARPGFESVFFRLSLAAALASSLGVFSRPASAQEAPAAPPATPPASPPASPPAGVSSDECPDADAAGTCLVGVRRLVGSVAASVDYAGSSASLGVGYLQTSLRRASYDASQRSDWYAYGVNGRAFLGGSNEGARGWGGAAVGRVGVGRRVGALLELTAGAARGDGRTLAFGTAGLFATIYYIDIGYSFQAPLGSERPEWLGTHLLSLRGHLPLFQWGEGEWRSSASWFPGS